MAALAATAASSQQQEQQQQEQHGSSNSMTGLSQTKTVHNSSALKFVSPTFGKSNGSTGFSKSKSKSKSKAAISCCIFSLFPEVQRLSCPTMASDLCGNRAPSMARQQCCR